MADDPQQIGKKRRLDEAAAEEQVPLAEEEYQRRIAGMLQNMTKETIIDILSKLGGKFQPVYDAVATAANADENNRKLFVHGLSWDTTVDSLRLAMCAYGEVESAHVVADRATGKSKGFGFVTFRTVDVTSNVIEVSKRDALSVDGRSVKANYAAERDKAAVSSGAAAPPPAAAAATGGGAGRFGAPAGGPPPPAGGGSGTVVDKSLRKFFLRSLPFSADDGTLYATFGAYGEVEEAVVVREKDSGKSKGYGFVTMRFYEGAQAVTMRPPRQMDGRDIVVQLASAGKDAPTLGGGGGGGGAYGGGGGAYGGGAAAYGAYGGGMPYGGGGYFGAPGGPAAGAAGPYGGGGGAPGAPSGYGAYPGGYGQPQMGAPPPAYPQGPGGGGAVPGAAPAGYPGYPGAGYPGYPGMPGPGGYGYPGMPPPAQ